ncbi:MAG: FKBP-type peptidyl-prolyl cis-trans isomerase [Balneolaceae bacterium]|nr:FKBP-type peptidyl-prolyl cis-trans isomerase [Balneolaceae bacterium]
MRTLLLLSILLFTAISCNRPNCDIEPNLSVDQDQLKADIAKIDAYLAENNIDAEKHPSGIRYVIIEEGDGDKPSVCGNVVVDYKGSLISDGSEFDKSSRPIGFSLRSLIVGWQVGIPLIKERGNIHLYIPSVYAYGATERPKIPANSNLFFEIKLYVTD